MISGVNDMAYEYYPDPRYNPMIGRTMQQDLNYINSFRPYQPMEYQPQNQFQQMNQQVPQTALQAAQTQNMNQPSNFTRTQQNVFVRAVTGREEAIAAQIPLDGSIVTFTDFAHDKIYTKQLNMNDGSAIFETYQKVKVQGPQEEPKTEPVSAPMIDPNEYVKRTDLNSLIAQMEENSRRMVEEAIANLQQKPNVAEPEQPAQAASSKSNTRGGSKQ